MSRSGDFIGEDRAASVIALWGRGAPANPERWPGLRPLATVDAWSFAVVLDPVWRDLQDDPLSPKWAVEIGVLAGPDLDDVAYYVSFDPAISGWELLSRTERRLARRLACLRVIAEDTLHAATPLAGTDRQRLRAALDDDDRASAGLALRGGDDHRFVGPVLACPTYPTRACRYCVMPPRSSVHRRVRCFTCKQPGVYCEAGDGVAWSSSRCEARTVELCDDSRV